MSTSTFTGSAVNVYAAMVLAKALVLYAKTGMKVNRAYTPKNMMATAAKVTGKTFKARDYEGAAVALGAYVNDEIARINAGLGSKISAVSRD
jgi:hypothetical protein